MKIIVLPILIMALFFISCEEEEPNHIYLDEELKSYIPFEEGEQLYYVANNTDTIKVIAKNKKIETLQGIKSLDYYEELSIDMVDSSEAIVFTIIVSSQSKSGHLIIRAPQNYSDLGYFYRESLGAFLDLKNLKNYNLDYSTNQSVVIRGRSYTDVMITSPHNEYWKLHYSRQYGVVKIESSNAATKDTKILELEKIVWN